jgi:hypothetical protein
MYVKSLTKTKRHATPSPKVRARERPVRKSGSPVDFTPSPSRAL